MADYNRPMIRPLPLVVALAISSAGPMAAESLRDRLGRNEVRVYSTPLVAPPRARVGDLDLAGRLEALGYSRVRELPSSPGEFFWGHDNFWVYRRASPGRDARLLGLALERPHGTVVGLRSEPGESASEQRLERFQIEGELLATSFDESRFQGRWIDFDRIPEHVWRPLLAIEDARFFEHRGIDGRAIARALLANVRSGGVVQGGSTITQQLIKLRDLSPRRSLGRKASEAVRALALEAEHTKEEILEAYLNSVYYGHVDGVSLYGLAAAARAYYSKSPRQLSLAEGAVLAAIVQAPNRMSPLRSPEAVEPRYRRVLDKLEEEASEAEGWIDPAELARARRRLPPVRPGRIEPPPARHYLRWLGSELGAEERGARVEATLDPALQRLAEEAVRDGLERLRRDHRGLRGRELQAALVALDATTGAVVAYVGGDPARPGEFDRARNARRQPGSTLKPLVALEALDACGRRDAVFPSRRIRDEPLTLELPAGDWSPQNDDRQFRGVVTVRDALERSLNVPLVRLARWCGFDATARRLRRAGLALPPDPPPSFVLGAIETSPLELATAYTALLGGGRIRRPDVAHRAWTPAGRRIWLRDSGTSKVASPAATYLVVDLLAREEGAAVTFGKTGTSSDLRDAWYAGGSGQLVTVVWVGLDDASPLGLSGARAAAPIWRAFVEDAAPRLGPWSPRRPDSVVEHWVDVGTGLRLARERKGAERFLFHRKSRPPQRRWWRRSSPLPPIE